MITKTEVKRVISEVERSNPGLHPFDSSLATLTGAELAVLVEAAKCAEYRSTYIGGSVPPSDSFWALADGDSRATCPEAEDKEPA